ncbi:MAG: Asp-tRNA(Asn)/Glu-tRNA(Gln) amidotransferase subunit GatC [Deltaproteobacteria bacterium]|nr:Asp-tRNA(Asn)/Glu-tRNA(Gln) amidotransferase subunit GatC [Deltaproteobacteria bacterium]
MAISKETVLHVSRLARLDLAAGLSGAEAEDKIGSFAVQMAQIVEYMDILNQADTSGVAPLFSPVSLTAAPRQDIPLEAGFSREQILANAPEQEKGMFVVPRVLHV